MLPDYQYIFIKIGVFISLYISANNFDDFYPVILQVYHLEGTNMDAHIYGKKL